MKRAGVIGWPIEHSLSPVLHGYWLHQYAIAGSYEKIAATPDDFQHTVGRLREEGYAGVNVTVPHKQAAFALADTKRQGAKATGAANLLVFTNDGRVAADNTDGIGLIDSLEQEPGGLGIASLGGRNIVILGAGGAARGIVEALYGRNVARITVLNRHAERAGELVRHASSNRTNVKFEAGALSDWNDAAKDAWLVINTTSAGMKGSPPLALDLHALPKDAAVCDIVYNPLETPLLKEARAVGLRPIDGLGMLMYQAAPSFQAFFFEEMNGAAPKVTYDLRKVLEKELQARG
jgi:shikimate dehydrogenase